MSKSTSILSNLPEPTYTIKELHITISLNRDMKSARYKYNYEIEKHNGFGPVWTHTFAYPLSDVSVVNVKVDDNKGPKWDLEALDTPEKNAQISIDLSDTSVFAFEVDTKIEATSNLTVLGGDGCVAFWVTHGGICQKLTLEFIFPSGFKLKHIHPLAEKTNGHTVFRKSGLLPREFFMVFLTYEKTVIGIPPKAARNVTKVLWLIAGAAISLLFAHIFGS